MKYQNQTIEGFGFTGVAIRWDMFWIPHENLVEYEEAGAEYL